MRVIKQITAILLLLVGLLVVSSAALAEPFFEVEANGIAMSDAEMLYLERGETVDLKVIFEFEEDMDDVKIEAELGGYEYDEVRDVTKEFDIHANERGYKTLTLELPKDMDAEENYTLYITIKNHQDLLVADFPVKIHSERHSLDIQDIILRPNTVQAGNALFATIRVENMGDRKEEDIKVSVSIPDLGVSARTYIDELVPVEENENYNEDDETSESSEEMTLRIPEDAATGDYTVEVTVSYNRGHETFTKTETIHVKTSEAGATGEVPKTLVSVDGTSKEVVAGIESAFKVMVANLGDDAAVYSVEVAGTDLWATARVEPAMVTLTPDSTGEMYVYVKPKAGTESGMHSFTFKVKSGSTIVAEKTLTADVTGTSASTSTTTATTNGQTNFASLKNALVIGFGVLVVLLVILGLIIAFNKMNKDEDEEIPTSEGQAYY